MGQMIQAIDIIRTVEIVRNRCKIVPTELRERLAAPASSVCVTGTFDWLLVFRAGRLSVAPLGGLR
jgi:hypothetical protein